MRQLQSKVWSWAYLMGAGALGAVLLVMSENLLFKDFGDFVRAIGGMLLTLPPNTASQIYAYRVDPVEMAPRFDLSTYVYGPLIWVQSLFSDRYDLRFQSILFKLLLLIQADLISREIAARFRHVRTARVLAFVAVCLSMFYAHNAGMLKSFYAENLLFLVLPLLLYGMLRLDQTAGHWAIVASSLVAGLSKVQYFCIPTIVLASLLVLRLCGRAKVPNWVLGGLVAVQLASLAPALDNPYAQLNQHQGTYWGSYLVLSQDELRGLGLSERQLACVGVDGWGHRAQGPGGGDPVYVGSDKSCYGSQTLGTRDVLEPYWRYPTAMPRLLAYALPVHFTVRYFHVYKAFPYLGPANGKSYRSGRWLIEWSAWRERVVTPAWPWLLLAGVGQAALRGARRHPGLCSASLFLALFIASQIVISLLGEGVRDLSKHLWGAQLALDFLVLALVAQAALAVRRRIEPTR